MCAVPRWGEPSPDRSTCQRCVNTTFSSFGIECRECPSPNVVDDTHASCTACRAGTGPAPNRHLLSVWESARRKQRPTRILRSACELAPEGSPTRRKTRCDVDECAQDNGQCDRLATRNGMASCTNTQGSHECGRVSGLGSGDLALGLPPAGYPRGQRPRAVEPTTQMTLGIAASVFLDVRRGGWAVVANMTSDLSLALEVSSTHP